MHWLIWILAAVALGLWSLLAWGLAVLLGRGAGWTGDLGPLIDALPFASVLDAWLPGWRGLLLALADLAHAGLAWLGDSAALVVWLVWGAGALMVLGTAGVLSLIVALVDKVPTPQRGEGR